MLSVPIQIRVSPEEKEYLDLVAECLKKQGHSDTKIAWIVRQLREINIQANTTSISSKLYYR